MTLQYSGTANGQSINYTASYNVLYATSSTIKVNLTYSSSSGTESITAWLSTSGTVIAAEEDGYNLTGSEASGMVVGLFAGFVVEVEAGQSIPYYSSTSQWESTGTSTVTIGTTGFTVTNYQFSSYPVTVTTCSGTSTLTAFSLSIGTPPGTTYQVVTTLNEAGSTTVNGQTENFDFTLTLTSLTVS